VERFWKLHQDVAPICTVSCGVAENCVAGCTGASEEIKDDVVVLRSLFDE
jgi:hypothetical protein